MTPAEFDAKWRPRASEFGVQAWGDDVHRLTWALFYLDQDERSKVTPAHRNLLSQLGNDYLHGMHGERERCVASRINHVLYTVFRESSLLENVLEYSRLGNVIDGVRPFVERAAFHGKCMERMVAKYGGPNEWLCPECNVRVNTLDQIVVRELRNGVWVSPQDKEVAGEPGLTLFLVARGDGRNGEIVDKTIFGVNDQEIHVYSLLQASKLAREWSDKHHLEPENWRSGAVRRRLSDTNAIGPYVGRVLYSGQVVDVGDKQVTDYALNRLYALVKS